MPKLSLKEELELRAKVQKLQWLLKECIGIEEYELCRQIRDIIKQKESILYPSNYKENEICPVHYITKGEDGFCPKCLESNNK